MEEIFVTPSNPEFYSRRKYKPLNFSRHEIRLLRIHPVRLKKHELSHAFPEWLQCDTDAARMHEGSCDDSIPANFICCSLLEPVDLDSLDEEYAALSYCAGNPKDSSRIMIDGFWFNAFTNLEHTLEGFRSHFDGRPATGNLVWADQICINQGNHEERGHQVSFMRNIYKQSRKTFRRRQASKLSASQISILTNGYAIKVVPGIAFLTIVKAKWWTRAWVFQEFVVSKTIVFICGSECVSLDELGHLLFFLNWKNQHPGTMEQFDNRSKSEHRTSIENPVKLLEIPEDSGHESASFSEQATFFLNARRHSYHFDIDHVFISWLSSIALHGFEASDRRDLIYAFLGLSKFTSHIIPDYGSNSVWDVCIKMTEVLLESLEHLILLRRAAETASGRVLNQPDLPSWVPDWTSAHPITTEGRAPYRFPSGVRHQLLEDTHRSKWKILHVQGVFLSSLGKESDDGIFDTSLPLKFEILGPVDEGDDLWALNQGLGIHVLRRRGAGEYSLVGLAFALPGKVESRYRNYLTISVDFQREDDYEVVMGIVNKGPIQWIDIF
ncbi:hypothetical protein GQ53DRAFT_812104 [Thozetella sp. PMI_491]|nr:hypothetical protein GQ53DRAFT_812104 [Thozetella sp. PMI_491]